MRRSPSLLSFLVAGSLICAPMMLPASAQAAPADDPAITEAQSLYEQGKNKFETAEYEDALALWKKAFEILPNSEETRGIRHALVYNIANAHSQAYEVSRNPTHLRKAKILLENYRAQHRELYGDDKAAVKERAEVDDRLAELEKLIAESEAAGEEATPLAEGGEGGEGTQGGEGTEGGEGTPGGPGDQAMPQPAPKPLTPQQQWEKEVKEDPELGPKWVKGQKRIVGGAVLAGIGSVFCLISITAFVAAPSAEFFPGLYYVTGGVTGAIGLGTLIPGAVLIAQGTKARRQVLEAKPRPITLVTPTLTPYGGGVSFALRF